MMNPTGLALDRAGSLYVSSRYDGTVYKVAQNGTMTSYAEGMELATGIAFDPRGTSMLAIAAERFSRSAATARSLFSPCSSPACLPITWRSATTETSTLLAQPHPASTRFTRSIRMAKSASSIAAWAARKGWRLTWMEICTSQPRSMAAAAS